MSNIIEENINLAFSFAHKFNKNYEMHSKYDYEDIISDCMLGLVKAAKYYKSDAGSNFSTFAHVCMKNEIMMSLRQKKKHTDRSFTFDIYDKDGKPIEDITVLVQKLNEFLEEDKIVNELWLQSSMKKLSKIQEKVISLYYFKNVKIQDIAKMLGVSDSYISKVHSSAIKKLRKDIW